MKRYLEISLMEENELSIDGQTRPAGNIEIREFEDGEWIGGSYTTYENLAEKVKEILEEDFELITTGSTLVAKVKEILEDGDNQ